MKDYEQKYYDLLYKYKKLKQEKEKIEEEMNIITNLNKCNTSKDVTKYLAKYITEYLKDRKVNK
jgi:hypothetical protein